ncbi:MAG TPA: flagellin [Planctomycetaceae bacterium]|nr:flagellin [Planctomycetaceae bacterium]
MTRINTNVESLRGLRNVQKANNLLSTSLQRLSTGIKINNGKDNPSGLIASEALRLQVTTIEQSIKNSNRANNVIGTADSALGEIAGLLNQVRGLVQEGLNVGALSQAETEANQSQIDAALSAINRISSNTSFAGDKLIDGSKAFTTAISSTNAPKLSDFQINEAIFGNSSQIDISAEVTVAAQKGQLRYDGGTLSSATTLEVSGNKGNQAVFLGASSSVVNIKDAVNAVSDATGVEAVLLGALTTGGSATAASLEHSTVDGVEAAREFQLAAAVQAQTSILVGANTDADANTASFRVRAVAGGAFDGAAGNAVNVSFVAGGAGAVTAAYAGNVLTVSLSTTGATNTAANISSAIAAATGAVGEFELVDVVVDTGDLFTGLTGSNADLDSGTTGLDNSVVFEAVTAGAAGNNITINYLQGADGSATSVAVDDSDPGDIQITFTLAAAAGAVTETAAGLATFLTTNAGAAADLARDYISATGNGTTAITTLTSNDLTGGADEQALTFTAVDEGTAGNNITVQLVQGADGSSTSVVTDASNPNAITITFTLSAAAGAITETTTGLLDFLANDASAEAVEARDYITGSGSGASAIENVVNTALTGGAASSGGVRFVDAREPGTAGTISVVLADPGSASQALSFDITNPDANGNQTITINLATDGTGAVTTTASQLVSALAADEDAAALVEANSTQAGILQAATTQDLEEGDDSALVLQSTEYGSRQYVGASALSGSFLATLSDGVTEAARDSGVDIGVRINGQIAESNGLQTVIKNAALDATFTFAEASNTVGETAELAITGGGSLFQIGQEATSAGQIGLGIDAVNTARLGGVSGKLYELGTGGGRSLIDIRDGLLGSGAKVSQSDVVSIIEEAIDRVSSLRGRLGALQKNVIETNITTLGVALENISEARSQIIDTDFAEETAQLQKAQILSQAGLSVLGIANQNPQQVLSLLR